MIDFGRKLKSIREQHNISLEDVSKQTSVRIQFLKLMEEGKFNELPQVYGKSFFKTYCQYLEIPEDEYIEVLTQIVNNYKSTNNSFNNSFNNTYNNSIPNQQKDKISIENFVSNLNKTRNNIKKSNISNNNNLLDGIFSKLDFIFKKDSKHFLNQKNSNQILNIGVVVGFLILLVIFFVLDSGDNDKSYQDELNDPTSPDTLILSTESQDKGLFDYFTSSDSLVLEGYAIDTCWIKLNIDGKINKEILTTPQMKMRWSATEYFIITQGNVGAVQFSRNGKPLEPFGARGSVVKNIKITKDEITQ